MKKLLLTMAVLATTLTGFSHVSVSPAEGNVNTTNDEVESYTPGGLSSICLNVMGSINRACPEPAVLYYNGEEVAALPASNTRRVYCESGYDKNLAVGNIRLDFYLGSAQTSPYNVNGNYELKIPVDFYTYNGMPNNAITCNWTITDHTSSFRIVPTPANNSTLDAMSQIVLTFEGATSVTVNNKSLISLAYTGGDGEMAIDPDIKVSSNVMTLTFPEVDKPGNIVLIFDYNEEGEYGVTANTPEGVEKISQTFRFTLMGKHESDQPMEITPAAGEVTGIPMREFECNNGMMVNGLFCVELPEGTEFQGFNTMAYIMIQDGAGKDVSARGNLNIVSNNATQFGRKVIVSAPSYSPFKDGIKLADGEYYLYIPDNCIKASTGAAVTGLPAMKFGPFTFKQDASAIPSYTISPLPDSELTEIKDIVITFEEGTVLDWDAAAYVTMTMNKTMYDFRPTVEGNVMKYEFPSPVTIPGAYNLEVSGLSFRANGFPMAIEATFNIVDNGGNNDDENFAVFADGTQATLTRVPENEEDSAHWYAECTIDSLPLQVQLVAPTGYNEVYYFGNNQINAEPMTISYIPAADLFEAGFVKAEGGMIPVVAGLQRFSFCFGKDGECTEPELLELRVNVGTGVDALGVEEGAAEYFTLQGVKVANPEKGIYIKVQNGKARKVLVK